MTTRSNFPALYRGNIMPFINDHFFDNFFGEDFNRLFGSYCYETDGGDCIYEMEVPGFNKDNLNVEISNGLLTISGEREVKSNSHAGNSKIFKQLQIGDIKEDEVTAKIVDGILTLTFKPQEPREGTKKIAIE